MAATLFTDVKFNPELYLEYMEELSANPAAFVQSGILRLDTMIQDAIQSEGSNYFTVPFFKPLTGDAQNYDGTDITINSIGSGDQSGIVIGRSNAWGGQDLAAELASKDPIKAIALKTVQYWREQRQKALINVLNGLFASADFATHVHDISIADGNNATEDNLIGADAVIDAIQKAIGDNGSKIVAISMHSKVYSRLQKLNLITFVAFGDQNIMVPIYLGKTVIVDDTHTVVAGGTSGYKYTSYLYARQSIATAEGKVKVPAETQRDSLKNGGVEWMVERQRFVLHPYGGHFNKSTMASISPTNAELATGTNWNKVYDNKNIPLIKLVTNG